MRPTGRISRWASVLENWRPSSAYTAFLCTVGALLTFAVCLPTLTFARAVFSDEITIAEYGRLFLDPRTDWSILWQGDHPITPWYYIGGTLQELATRAMSPSCSGTRLGALVGAVLSASALVAWLLRRGTLPATAFLLSLLLPLFEPPFRGRINRGGRVDGWTTLLRLSRRLFHYVFRSQPAGMAAAGGRLARVSRILRLAFNRVSPASTRARARWNSKGK